MAQQKSILKLKGTIGGITFYKTKDGYLAREKGGVDASRIANDPGFARTRENGAEFANAASAGKLLRDAVRLLGKDASDGRVTARLTQVMAQIKNLDDANARGERHVGEGMNKDEAKVLLNGFNFNVNSVLGSVLFKAYLVDTGSGEITITGVNPKDDINLPNGATHVIFRSGFASVNFITGETDMTVSDAVKIEINSGVQDIAIRPNNAPSVDGRHFYLLAIDFVQSINNTDYSLNNNAYNVLAIVGIE